MSGFRPPLDLTDVLKHYEQFGGSSTAGMRDIGSEWWQKAPGWEERERQAKAAEERANAPQQFGGQPIFSTSTVLVPSPLICWDANGYYRVLGVHWKATKKELMKAYQALGNSPGHFQTYAFKQLLDPQVRREYDLTPLGEPYMNDKYVQDYLKQEASKEAARRSAAGVPTTAREVIEEKYRIVPDTPNETVDSEDPGVQTRELSEAADTVAPWPYGYFLWRSNNHDTERLREWQELLVRAFAERQETVALAVGHVGRMAHRYVVGRVGTQYVVFLGDKQIPTEELAGSAAEALLRDMHQTSTTS